MTKNNGTLKSIIATSGVLILLFTTIIYTSCNKEEPYTYVDSCEGITCQNDGNCVDGSCYCPSGFEGEFCENKWLSRFIGNWEVTETVEISNQSGRRGQQYAYRMNISQGGTSNTTFAIGNFMGNPSYNNILCKVGLNEKGELTSSMIYSFVPDQVLPGTNITLVSGEGNVNGNSTVINGKYEIRYVDTTSSSEPRVIQEIISFSGNYAL